jgi:hypothetical protein
MAAPAAVGAPSWLVEMLLQLGPRSLLPLQLVLASGAGCALERPGNNEERQVSCEVEADKFIPSVQP